MFTAEQAAWIRGLLNPPGGLAPAGGAGLAGGDDALPESNPSCLPASGGSAPAAPPAEDSFPQPMQPDCKVVRGQVPGPRNFVLCATHGHILDTDKKQIVAKNLKEFEAQYPEFAKAAHPPGGHPASHARPKPVAPAAPAAPPSAEESFVALAAKLEKSATGLATSLKGVTDFEWNSARDGCASELAAVGASVASMLEVIGHIQKYTNTIGNGDAGQSLQLELIVASRTTEDKVEGLIDFFDKDVLMACMGKRNDTYKTDTGSADGAVGKAVAQYGKEKTAVMKAAGALLAVVGDAKVWNQKNGKIITW